MCGESEKHFMSDQRTTQVLQRFNQAFISHDPTLLEELLAEDCVLESAASERYFGRAACLEFWSKMAADERLTFEPEDMWVSGERGVIRFRTWQDSDGDEPVRGVNLMRVRAGRIIESLGYVKNA
jgi:ketosteroid isomerase-like protein